MANTLTFGNYTVELSNEDKVLFPESGMTKGELIDYYEKIADTMLPHLQDRPVTLQRFPDGIDKEGFYQKSISDYFPDWIERETVSKENGKVTHVICNNTATLVYLANQACITPHVWTSRRSKPHHPDLMVFDLDPPSDDFTPVRQAARALHELLGDLDLRSFVKTTGSKGAHVVVPLDKRANFDTVRDIGQRIAKKMAEQDPDEWTTEQRKDKRKGRVFIDTNRNAYGQTAVTPYAVRARENAPVATPLHWDELDDSDLTSTSFTIKSMFRRLGQTDDPWKNIYRHQQSLEKAEKKLG